VFRAALPLFLAAALGAAPLLARADVYRWVDESGATHFAPTRDEVPSRYRDSAQVIPSAPSTVQNPSSARPPAPPPHAATPAPEPALPAPAPAPAPSAPPPASGPESRAPDPEPSAPAAVAAPPRSEDPRSDEIADLEGRIERDREQLRLLISTPRWDSSELASDPRVREIAERLPRLQAELAALRSEGGH